MRHTHKIYQGSDGRWRTYIYDEDGNRRMITAKDRMKLEKRLAEIYQVDSEISMAGLLTDWGQYKRTHVAENTWIRIKNTWDRYYAGHSITEKPISSITKIEVDRFIHETIRATGMTRKEYANFVTILNQLLDYAVDIGLIDHNVKRDVRVARGQLRKDTKAEDRTQVFSQEEFLQLKKMAMDDFENNTYPVNSTLPLACLFMFYSGLRISEIVVLKKSDITGDVLHVCRMYRHNTKEILDDTKGSFGDRFVPLIPEAKEILALAQSKQEEKGIRTEYIFSMHKEPLAYHALQKVFYKYSRKVSGTPKSSHKARKTFVSSLIDAGVNINTVRQIVGHVDERTTLHNYTYDRKSDQEKLETVTEALSSKLIQNNPKKDEK